MSEWVKVTLWVRMRLRVRKSKRKWEWVSILAHFDHKPNKRTLIKDCNILSCHIKVSIGTAFKYSHKSISLRNTIEAKIPRYVQSNYWPDVTWHFSQTEGTLLGSCVGYYCYLKAACIVQQIVLKKGRGLGGMYWRDLEFIYLFIFLQRV